MKILYISATSYIIYMITNMDKMIPDRKTYDTFKTHYVYVVCAVLGLITNIIQGFDIIDVSLTPHYIYSLLSHLLSLYSSSGLFQFT